LVKNSALKAFLDTGAFLALADEDDKYHSAATPVYAELLQARAQLLTSNFVLSETYTLIRFKVGHSTAVDFMKSFAQTGIKILRVSERLNKQQRRFSLDIMTKTLASSIAPALR
jgi:predicted nucleic acid-binding protein